MSYSDLDSLTPVPGDLVMARVCMRAWESEERKGLNGAYIDRGEQALIITTWSVGNQLRIKLLRDQRLLVFSCAEHCVRKNWKVVRPAPRLPTLGCP